VQSSFLGDHCLPGISVALFFFCFFFSILGEHWWCCVSCYKLMVKRKYLPASHFCFLSTNKSLLGQSSFGGKIFNVFYMRTAVYRVVVLIVDVSVKLPLLKIRQYPFSYEVINVYFFLPFCR
jgi:hypothetical protein